MIKALTGAAAAGLLALSFYGAHAMPIQSAPAGAAAPGAGIVNVHGFHRSCKLGPGGWHRHNKFGERRPCRRWGGKGKRPDACIKVGPIWYCDY
jgi:hypothetical protein